MNQKNSAGYSCTKYLLISPFKLRKLVSKLPSKNCTDCLSFLNILPHSSANYLYKSLKSSMYNAVNNNNHDINSLEIETILVEEGSRLKRFKARARGRGNRIIRRTSHIKVFLKLKNGVKNGTEN